MREYQVINPIKRDGKTLRSGTVMLDDIEGAQLMQHGFVSATAATLASESTEAADPPLSADNETGANDLPADDVSASQATTDASPATEAGGGESPAAAPGKPRQPRQSRKAK